MNINFGTESDVFLYSLEQNNPLCQVHHYIFAAQCVWWLASLLGLQQGLLRYTVILAVRSVIIERGISTTPLDTSANNQVGEVSENFPSRSSDNQQQSNMQNYISDPLRRTRKGRVSNSLP